MLRAIREHRLWQPGARVVVGVSGGPDSVAMLAGLAELPRAWRPEMCAATLDHGLRPAARVETEAVARLAAQLGVPFEVGAADVRARARTDGRGLEAAARTERYAFLTQVCRRREARIIAVGHHRDDQAETVLLRLLRGAGSRGLSGMRPRRPLVGPDHFHGWLVRPLWLVGRADILEYLRERGLPWSHDETNDQLVLSRNRIRHRIVPVLEREFGPGVRRTLARAADHLAAEDDALRVWAQRVLTLRRSGSELKVGGGFARLPPAVRARVVQAWWEAVTGLPPLGTRHVATLDALPDGGGVDLPRGYQAHRDREVIRMQVRPVAVSASLTLSVPGSVDVADLGRVTARVAANWPDTETARRGHPHARVAAIDLDAVALPLCLRVPQPGERLRALGAPAPRAIRELLRDSGIPSSLRGRPLVVTDACGRVLWLAGARQAEAFRLTGGARRVLVLTLEPSDALPAARSHSLS